MRHAGAAALDDLEADVLAVLRTLPGLRERTRGTFLRRGRAFLHFHEDPAGLFVDVRLGSEPGATFERMRVSTAAERRRLLTAVRAALDAGAGGG